MFRHFFFLLVFDEIDDTVSLCELVSICLLLGNAFIVFTFKSFRFLLYLGFGTWIAAQGGWSYGCGSGVTSTGQEQDFDAVWRGEPVHEFFGGSRSPDGLSEEQKDICWRTFILVLLNARYHLIGLIVTFDLHPCIVLLCNATTCINKKPPDIPEVHLPEEPKPALRSLLLCGLN